jgi:translocation and assembly module TamA
MALRDCLEQEMTQKLWAACAAVVLALGPIAAQPQVSAPAPSPGPGEPATPAPSFDLVIRAPDNVRPLLERHLELRRYREVPDLDDAELARLMGMAERDARQLLATQGYFSPQVSVTRENGTRPAVVVAVDLRNAARISEVDIGFTGDIATTADADAVAQRERIRRGWGLPVGQVFTQDRWDDAKGDALRELTARRYLAGRLADSLADVDAVRDAAALSLRFDSGPLYRLGPMQVSGMERYDPVLVPRLARLPPGSEYDLAAIQRAQLRLAGSGYFDSAFIHVDPEGDPAAAPVQVTVREARLQKLVLGLGLSTDTGARASIEHLHNRVPGIGWRAETKLQIDRVNPFAQTEWTDIPDEDGWRWSVLGRAERVKDGDLITHAQRLRAGRFRSEENIDRNIYGQYDRATVRTDSGAPIDAGDAGDGSALSANYVWTGRYFDDPLLPTRGYGVGFELGGGLTLGGDRAPFQRTVLRGMWLRPLERGRLQLRGEAGAVISRAGARLPSTQLFRTGGDTSVRGYGFRDIGVPLPNGRTGPGRLMVVGSAEWQRPIRRNGVQTDFESVVFVDAGAVADRVKDLRPHVGVGAGVRWKSPVGPVDAALAYGLKSKEVRLHFTVGFTF